MLLQMKETAKNSNFKGHCAHLDSPRKKKKTNTIPLTLLQRFTPALECKMTGVQEIKIHTLQFHPNPHAPKTPSGLSPTYVIQNHHTEGESTADLKPLIDYFHNTELMILSLFPIPRDGCSSVLEFPCEHGLFWKHLPLPSGQLTLPLPWLYSPDHTAPWRNSFWGHEANQSTKTIREASIPTSN